jgi:hypothetical protein
MSDPCAPRRGLFVAPCTLDRVYRVSRAPTRHTSTQPAFTRAVADHLFANYAGVLKIDGALGEKAYHPRAYGKPAEAAMAAPVVRACEDPGSVVTALAS